MMISATGGRKPSCRRRRRRIAQRATPAGRSRPAEWCEAAADRARRRSRVFLYILERLLRSTCGAYGSRGDSRCEPCPRGGWCLSASSDVGVGSERESYEYDVRVGVACPESPTRHVLTPTKATVHRSDCDSTARRRPQGRMPPRQGICKAPVDPRAPARARNNARFPRARPPTRRRHRRTCRRLRVEITVRGGEGVGVSGELAAEAPRR